MTNNNSNEPKLYGISSLNSNRRNEEMWGKNCFNNAFPTSLACYMRDKAMNAVYVNVDCSDPNKIKIQNTPIDIGDVFNSKKPNSDLFFSFETKFSPYEEYVFDNGELDKADLVIKHGDDWLRMFQIKLTVIPDDGTSKENCDQWSPEIVIRPADTSSCALGMFHDVASSREEIRRLFENPCDGIDWDALPRNNEQKELILNCVKLFIRQYSSNQKPYLLQPIWMTRGKQPHLLEENAFDLFVWSDYALMAACLHKAKKGREISTRSFRAVARFARAQYDLAIRGNIRLRDIYRKMDFGRQTDKEMAFSGKETRGILISPHRIKPQLPASVLQEIILNRGHKKLSPERRFDQTVYFTAEKFFDQTG